MKALARPPAGTPLDRLRMVSALLLWQGAAADAPVHGNVLLWQGTASGPGRRSLTEHLEENSIEVRRRYLAWSHELGETLVFGRPLRERLHAFRAGSLWPVSMFVEQSTWKQASLEKILKLLALELMLEKEHPESLTYAGADRDLSRVLAAMCRERHMGYAWQRLSRPAPRARTAWWRQAPHALLAPVAALHFLLRSRRLPRPRPLGAPGAPRAGRRMLICAPFINHGARADSACNFTSQYWTDLPAMLASSGSELLWLHIFYPHARIPTDAEAARIVARIQADSPSSGAHGFVDAYFSAHGLLRLLGRWAAVALGSVAVGVCLRARFARRPRESFWPLLRSDWACAFRGVDCVATLFLLECFDQALADISRQDEGIYLMENQGWERVLIAAWRRHGHGRLTGVAHSTLRFWDLRYHSDPRRYAAAHRGQVPEPDVVAVNGPQARREFLASCAEREPVVECEALRYLQLGTRVAATRRVRAAGQPMRLLVLGDFLEQSTLLLLQLVDAATRGLPRSPEVWVKAHPNCPADPTSVPGLALSVVQQSVATLVPAVDLVLASNTTSAALDAYLSGAEVVVYDDRSGVNFSPLRGVRGVHFVHDAPELARRLAEAGDNLQCAPPTTAQFFHTEAALPRWRAHFRLDPCDSRDPDAPRALSAQREDSTT